MSPSASKPTLLPSELAQLEHAFATDPTSEAYKPLAEAYLAMGRFMEAMVVCKKGVKAHPDHAAARVLLARVYAEQGKDKKALDELQGALQVSPSDPSTLRMMGGLLCKSGDMAGGTEKLKAALNAAPGDQETLELCQQYNITVAAPAVAAAPASVPASPASSPGSSSSISSPPPPPPEETAPKASTPAAPSMPAFDPSSAVTLIPTKVNVGSGVPAAASMSGSGVKKAGSGSGGPKRRSSRQSRVSYAELAMKYGEAYETPVMKKSHSHRLGITLGLIFVGLLGLGGYYYTRKVSGERDRKIGALLKQVQEEIGHDSFAGYKKACEFGEQIINGLDHDLYSAHAYLAYAYAIRWGEHGEGEVVEKLAREHLERGKAAKTEHSHLIAAEAYIRFFGGDPRGAEQDLEKVVADFESKGKKSNLLLAELGILQMHSGNLDKAFRSLKAAQNIAPADPRINAALGDVLRRQGNEFLAANAYESALRYEKDHAEAQLGVALMAIDTNRFETADKYLRKLLAADPPPSARQLAVARLAHAIVLDEQGKTNDADKEQTIAFDTDSNNPELLILKSRRLMRAGKVDEAVSSIREAIKKDPKRANFYVELAKALVSKPGGAKEAVASMKEALHSMPGSPKLLMLLGEALLADNNIDEARVSFETALKEAGDKLPEARLALADLARSKKDYPRALDLYEKAKNEYVSSTKKQAYALTEMGKIMEEQGKEKGEVFKMYRQAASIDSSYGPAVFLLARMLTGDRDRKKREQAFELIEQYLKMDPKGEYSGEASRLLAEHRRW